MVLSQDGAPSVLLDADDSVVFVLLELTLIAVSVLFLVMWRPFAAWRPRLGPGSRDHCLKANPRSE